MADFIILLVLLFIATIAIGVLAFLLFKKWQQAGNYQQQLSRYQGLVDVEAEQARIQQENDTLTTENDTLRQKGRAIRDAVATLRLDLADLEEEQAFAEVGLYKPRYDFGSSERYKKELDALRKRQRQMVRDKNAILWGTEWQVQGSKAKGRSMMKHQTKLALYAFNGECDSLIIKVKYNNIDRISQRIRKAYDAINKLGKTHDFQINPQYLDLKIRELHLVHEYQVKRQAEKEEQRRIREEMREEQRAQRELEKARKEAEREETRYQRALAKARKELTQATADKQADLAQEIEELNQMLAEAQEKNQRAISRAQMTKSGHVYVVSNIGSFGEGVYKIGMTRRLEPMDRVRELGDASVPFLFDVHAIIYADDAPALEAALHQAFDDRRVNLVNSRKEFFRITLAEVVDVVTANHGEVEFTMKAEAEEYRQTQSILAEQIKANGNGHVPQKAFVDVLGA